MKRRRRHPSCRAGGEKVDLLNPITINDKIGTVSLFFEWAKSRDSGVVNPVGDQRIQRSKNKRKGKKRHPWTVEELSRMFAAPIYAGCRSVAHWKQPGIVLRQSAKYWVPLIALFSGMRLGEIIQMQVSDVKCLDGIEYFDVAPSARRPLPTNLKRRSVCLSDACKHSSPPEHQEWILLLSRGSTAP